MLTLVMGILTLAICVLILVLGILTPWIGIDPGDGYTKPGLAFLVYSI